MRNKLIEDAYRAGGGAKIFVFGFPEAHEVDDEFAPIVDFLNVIPEGLICYALHLDDVGLIVVVLIDLTFPVGWVTQVLFRLIILLDFFDLVVFEIVRVSHFLFFVEFYLIYMKQIRLPNSNLMELKNPYLRARSYSKDNKY